MSATDAYQAARDQLLALRERRDQAVADFRFPDVGDRWNWAIDWFDVFARGNSRPGLIVVEEDGSSTTRSFADLS